MRFGRGGEPIIYLLFAISALLRIIFGLWQMAKRRPSYPKADPDPGRVISVPEWVEKDRPNGISRESDYERLLLSGLNVAPPYIDLGKNLNAHKIKTMDRETLERFSYAAMRLFNRCPSFSSAEAADDFVIRQSIWRDNVVNFMLEYKMNQPTRRSKSATF